MPKLVPAGLTVLLALVACGKFQSLEDVPRKIPMIGTFRFIEIPPGLYDIGAVAGASNERPRQARTDGFFLSVTEITRAQFEPGGDATPATGVTLDAARAFCRKLSAENGHVVRLPTADEWEIAARGGIAGAPFPWGWGSPADRAAFDARSARPAGSFPANGYGLFDMAGNAAEWSDDGFVCGGSWAERDPAVLQVFRRQRLPDGYAGADVGFRILIEKSEKTP